MSDVSITPATGIGMVTLRGDMATLAATAGLPEPGSRLSVRQGSEALLWMAPDEALLLCADAPSRAAGLAEGFGGAFATAVDVSDARAVFDVKGPHAAAILAKLMPVDFAALAPGEVRRTRLAQIAAAVWAEEGGYRVVCFRSVADYALAALTNAAEGPVPPPAAS